jgi:hypothetical protein
VVAAPIGYVKTEDQRLEKNPDRRVQEAITLIFRKFQEIGSVGQTLMWFLDMDSNCQRRRHEVNYFGDGLPIVLCTE